MAGRAARDGGDGVARLHRVAAAAAVHMGVDEAWQQYGTAAFTVATGVVSYTLDDTKEAMEKAARVAQAESSRLTSQVLALT